MYLPGLRNFVADALGRHPGEVDLPADGDIGDSGSGSYELQNPLAFAAIED